LKKPIKVNNNPLAVGEYFTAVNVHNPSRCDTITFRWKVAVGLPGLKVGKVTDFSEATLGPDEALEIDCRDILKKLSNPAFVKGWVVIENDSELDVVAVYSAAKEPLGKVETLHTERVKPRCMDRCGDFNLDISTGVSAWQIKAPGGTGFSTATLVTKHPAWSLLPNSVWASISGGEKDAPGGTYEYRLPFYLCSGFKNAELELELLADNSAKAFLNGVQIGTSSSAPFTTASSITVTGPFKAGLNVLTIQVKNERGTPTGLDISGFISAERGLCAGKGLPLLPCPTLCYRGHVKDDIFDNIGIGSEEGWFGVVCNGATAGTTGRHKRLEAIQIWLNNAPPGTTIEYRGHTRTFAGTSPTWTSWTPEGQECGTTYENRKLTAVEIRLVNAPVKCRVRYRVHRKTEGWNGWVYDGALAGSTAGTVAGKRRIEAIEIVIE
jgi:hypothetical protein